MLYLALRYLQHIVHNSDYRTQGLYRGAAARCVPPRRRPDRLCDVGPATPAIELDGDQLGELGRDVGHRIFCGTQAGSRAEQRADFAESFVRRLVHNRDELVTR